MMVVLLFMSNVILARLRSFQVLNLPIPWPSKTGSDLNLSRKIEAGYFHQNIHMLIRCKKLNEHLTAELEVTIYSQTNQKTFRAQSYERLA